MSLNISLRARWGRRVRRWGDAAVAELRVDLDRLGYGWWPIPPRMMVALRHTSAADVPWFFFMLAAVMLAYVVAVYFVVVLVFYHGQDQNWRWLVAWAILVALLMKLCVKMRDAGLPFVRNQITSACRATIRACAEAYGASHIQRPEKLFAVGTALRRLEGNVMRAHRRSGTVAFLSPRRRELKTHAGQVVAKLREAEAGLDHSPHVEALSEIAGLVVTIAERYVDGHIGALLPEPLLEGKKPVPDRELLRVSAAVVLIAGGVVGLAFLELPDMAMAVAGTAWSVLTLMAFFGRNWAQYLPVFDLFKPGP
ncbi:hypothetical protein RGF97_17270 [Streptomyces roseicoloratus]|uniref:Integral membrane protein n=1 Tax=Streptomyces roseicoloratus TaxID=2508722 RepID=A0ABY9RVM3_9ACTN|nr:hypothetical protein [Streptomyces roseicoloratus]WMX46239.1 hypothetical protein RGF97_17270 [Streptomyces roseicoloratus]